MKKSFIAITILFIVLSLANPGHLLAQKSTFAFKLNDHKYNQQEDLMIRGIKELFAVAMDSLNLPALLDTLAIENGLDTIELLAAGNVDVVHEVDETETYDFKSKVTIDTLRITATGFGGCQFDVDIIEAGFVLGGVSDYIDGEFKIDLGDAETIHPQISVVGTGHILCPGIAEIFKSAMESEIDTLLASLASTINNDYFDGLLTFLNPIQSFGLEDSVLIKQALESFPMEMDLYTAYDQEQDVVQLILDIKFLMGTTDNPSAFIDTPVPDITESQLTKGGFSFLYWVLQQGFLWNEWSESQRVDEALGITESYGFKDFRLELRWSDLQILAYRGGELDPADISPEDIDGLIADTDHWDTTAFQVTDVYLNNGLTRKLRPFMAVGVGHEDRMPFDLTELRIAPATEGWIAPEGYTGVSANEYLYNLKIYAHATVKRFADEIDIWQIENELNAAGFAAAVPEWWRKGDLWLDTDFRNKVWQILVEAVRVEDPSALIVHDLHMLGFMQGLEQWIEDMDIIGINYYPNQIAALPGMGFTVGEYVWAVRRALIGLGQSEKTVWLTETGYPGIEIEDPPDDIMLAEDVTFFSESRQNEYVDEALTSAVEKGVSGFFYYSLVTQEDFAGDLPVPMRFSGMIRRDDTYKPALQTYADLYEQFLVIENPVAIGDDILISPKKASLYQNYPNPFNPKTVIRYTLPVNSIITLHIFDVQGKLIDTIFSGKQQAGDHKIEWNASHMASGIYYVQLKTENFSDIKKMILIK